MKRSALFTLALLMISALALGQAVVTPSGQATTAGVAVPVAPVSPPLLVTPIVHLSTASTLPGSNGGAVAATEPPTAPGIRPEINYGQPIVYLGVQPPSTEALTAPGPAATGAPIPFDMGVTANGATAADNNGLNGRSLGEVARELRQKMQNTNAKLYTNADIAPNAGGITGTTANVAPQQFPPNSTYPVGDNGVVRQNGQSSAAGQAIASPQNPNGNATPEQPATEQNEQPQPQAQPMNQPAAPATNQPIPPQKPSAGTGPPPQQMAQAQAPANPADQNAAAGQAQPEQEGSQKTLPKSASLLPLIALVGAAATVAGLLARK